MIRISRLNRQDVTAFIFSVMLFILSMPYFVWNTELLRKAALFSIIFIALINIRNPRRVEYAIIPFFIFYVVYLFYINGSNLFGYISGLVVVYILLMKINILLLIYKYFKLILLISFSLSLATYAFVVIFNVGIPYNLIPPMNLGKGGFYVQYPFLVSEGIMGFRYLNIRFSGMFDEPGVVGSLAVIFLLMDRYSLRSRANKIFLISGILSFSFYFYVCSLSYFVYLLPNTKRILVILVFFTFFLVTKDNIIVSELVWDRFVLEDLRFSGDNRSTKTLDNKYYDFLRSDDVLVGKGMDYTLQYAAGTSSFKSLIISYGVLFFVSVLIAFMTYSFYHIRTKKYVLAFWFLFLGMLYQRYGFIYDPPRFFLFIVVVYILSDFAQKELSQKESSGSRLNKYFV